MRISAFLLLLFVLTGLRVPSAAQDRQHVDLSPKLLSAKSVYFDDQTGVAAVGDKALAQLKKWRRFQIVQDRSHTDLIILLSAAPPKGTQIITAAGRTGTVGNGGNLELDPVPTFDKVAPVRYAYLTVIDPQTGARIWSDSHRWGGLLTGFNSAGQNLIKNLKKKFDK